MNMQDGVQYSGKFTVDDRELDGELTFASSETKLFVHSHTFFRPDKVPEQVVFGILRNLTRVSLIQCLLPLTTSTSWVQKLGKIESATIFPHYVLVGNRHLGPNEHKIKSIHLVLKDAAAIFPDYRAFSTAIGVKSNQLRALLKGSGGVKLTSADIGKYPIVAYFTGKSSIFEVKTIVGKITASHMPSFGSGGANGVSIENQIGIRIDFLKLAKFSDALHALKDVLPFFEILAARRQEIAKLEVMLKERKGPSSILNVYWCNPPRRGGRGKGLPHPFDLPIDATRDRKNFQEVLVKWLARHDEWRVARSRFSSSFCKENFFDTDRLIGSANMFDLLPSSAAPKSVSLEKELVVARDAAKNMFKALPDSAERSSVLSALGRLGQASLKRKVHHRAEIVLGRFPHDFPFLLEVLDLAIDARNHFVHGSETDIDYSVNAFSTINFFSKALEFVFVTSDLIENGWDAHTWRSRGTAMSHPFGEFLCNYRTYLTNLKGALPPNHRIRREHA